MKYWLFQNNQVVGPHTTQELPNLPGFSAESLVCPEGRKGTQMGDWQRAGVVAELADALLALARVPAGAGGGSMLPPEPTLRDLAALGSLQEKVGLLESSISHLQEELKTRDTEIASLKKELEQKKADISSSTDSLKAELVKTQEVERATASTQSEQAQALEELKKKMAELQESYESLRRELKERPAPTPAPEPAAFAPTPEPSPMPAPAPAPFEAPSPFSTPPAAAGPEPLIVQPEPLGGPSAAAPAPAPVPEKLSPLPLSEPISLEPEPAAGPGILTPSPFSLPGSQEIPNTQIGGPTMLGTPTLDIPASAPVPDPGQLNPLFPTPAPQALKPGPGEVVDLSFSGAAKIENRRRTRKLLLPLLMLAGLGAGAAYYLGYLDAFLGARVPAQNEEAPAPEQPAQPPVDVQGGMPDRTPEAVELVKTHLLPDGRPVALALEGPNPPLGLSPWMVEKTPEGRYQINFYSQKKGKKGAKRGPQYQFEADLDARSVRGLNAAAQALLSAPAPKSAGGLLDDQLGAPAPEGAKAPRRKRRARRPAASAGADGLLEEGQPSQEASAASTADAFEAPPAAKPAPKTRRKAAPEKEASIDELLLPGVPKPEGGHAELERLLDQ